MPSLSVVKIKTRGTSSYSNLIAQKTRKSYCCKYLMLLANTRKSWKSPSTRNREKWKEKVRVGRRLACLSYRRRKKASSGLCSCRLAPPTLVPMSSQSKITPHTGKPPTKGRVPKQYNLTATADTYNLYTVTSKLLRKKLYMRGVREWEGTEFKYGKTLTGWI